MELTVFETNITAAVEALREQAGDRWRVPEALLSRTMEYYTRKAQQVREHLNAGASKFWELSPEMENALLEDYARALFGVFDFTATRDQMERLRALRSTRPFLIDRYGLYYAVLGGYSDIARRLYDYERITAPTDQYRGTNQTDELQAFINGPTYTAEGRAVSYLLRSGGFDAARFSGVTGPAEVNAFLDRCELFGAVYDYATYYGVCKYCLNATREELAAIPTPRDKFGDKTPQQFAEQAAATVNKRLDRVDASLADVFDATTAEATTEAKAQAREQIEQAPRDLVRVSDTFAALLSRDVYGSKYGENVRNENDILPIQSFIAAYMEKHPDAVGQTTPRIIEKTIEGVNLLQRKQRVTPVNGLFTFNTNISEFAELCGYTDAGEDQKRAILLALSVLNGLYLAVWRPRGLAAIKMLTVREIGLTGQIKGNLIIDVSTDATKGRPQLLGYSDFERLRREAKGYAENHFRYQIIAKGHKTENALLDEIFGYTNAIREATEDHADAETLNALRRNQQKNRPRDRVRLQRMFEREAAAGFLRFKRYTNTKGETVYSWQRTAAATPEDPNGEQEPDEQQQPE